MKRGGQELTSKEQKRQRRQGKYNEEEENDYEKTRRRTNMRRKRRAREIPRTAKRGTKHHGGKRTRRVSVSGRAAVSGGPFNSCS